MAGDFFDIRGRRERQRERQREYNRFEAGKARHRKGRQSPQGKAKLKQRYKERKKWLDEIKAQRGCCLCKEKNPLLLGFRLRDGEKAKFPPSLQNISRSKKDWFKVIKASDVLCVRCLVVKYGRKPFGGRTQKVREMPENNVQDSAGAAIERERSKIRGNGRSPEEAKTKAPQNALTLSSKTKCSTCRLRFIPKRRNKKGRTFCSPRCRLLFWSSRQILELYGLGQADGLQKIIAELVEVKR